VTASVPKSMDDRDLEVEIGALAGLDFFALKERWKLLYGSEPPVRMSRELMLRAVAYRIQERALGGLSRTAKVRLTSYSGSSAAGASSRKPERSRNHHSIKPGTKLIREWNGRMIEVIAMADGRYLYDGVAYRSLSVIAREFTGTRWSGPAFFGLNGKRKAGDGKD
jgi:hypothetical protein